MTTALLANYYSAIMHDQPLRYYRLDEAGGTVANDKGTQGQNGTLHGTITQGSAGLITGDPDAAMTFDGSTGYISLPTTGLPTGANPFTLEMWMKMPSFPGSLGDVFNFGTFNNSQLAALYYSSNAIFFGFDTGSDISTAISTGTIYHVVGAYDGTTARLYLNGVLKANVAITLNIALTSANIGRDDHPYYWPGVCDECAIYNKALSADQIARHYHAGIDSNILVHGKAIIA